MLKQVSELLMEPLTPADIIGNLGGYAFGLVIFGSGEAGADAYLSRVKETIAATQFQFEGQNLSLNINVGMTIITASDSPESVLDAADKNRKSGDNVRE